MTEVLLCTPNKRHYRTKKYKPTEVLLRDLSREEIAQALGMSPRTLQELLHLAANFIDGFDKYLDDECRLNGYPIKHQYELDLLAEIFRLRGRYKGVKDGSLMIKDDLAELNKKYKRKIEEAQNEN